MKTIDIDEANHLLRVAGYDDDQLAKVHSWHDAARYVLIFQNQDLGHSALGHMFAMPWDDQATIPPHGPDHPSIGFGWRYVTEYVVEPVPAVVEDLGPAR
jgi:hypothetical protein